jgi:hypothetical protein
MRTHAMTRGSRLQNPFSLIGNENPTRGCTDFEEKKKKEKVKQTTTNRLCLVRQLQQEFLWGASKTFRGA